jgi:hypothetical protein
MSADVDEAERLVLDVCRGKSYGADLPVFDATVVNCRLSKARAEDFLLGEFTLLVTRVAQPDTDGRHFETWRVSFLIEALSMYSHESS